MAVQNDLKKHATLVDNVYYVMLKLSNEILATKQRNYSLSIAQEIGSSRWTSTFLRFKRHRRIRKFNGNVKIADVNNQSLRDLEKPSLTLYISKEKIYI